MGVEKAAGYEIYGLGSDEVFVVWKYDITSLYNLLYLGCAFSFIVATLVAVLHHKGNVLRDIVAVRKCKDLHEREEYAFYLNIIVFVHRSTFATDGSNFRSSRSPGIPKSEKTNSIYSV